MTGGGALTLTVTRDPETATISTPGFSVHSIRLGGGGGAFAGGDFGPGEGDAFGGDLLGEGGGVGDFPGGGEL